MSNEAALPLSWLRLFALETFGFYISPLLVTVRIAVCELSERRRSRKATKSKARKILKHDEALTGKRIIVTACSRCSRLRGWSSEISKIHETLQYAHERIK